MKTTLVLSLILAIVGVDIAAAQELQAIKLPEVKLVNDMPLMQALKERKSYQGIRRQGALASRPLQPAVVRQRHQPAGLGHGVRAPRR